MATKNDLYKIQIGILMAMDFVKFDGIQTNSRKFCSTKSFGVLAQNSHGFNPLIFLFL